MWNFPSEKQKPDQQQGNMFASIKAVTVTCAAHECGGCGHAQGSGQPGDLFLQPVAPGAGRDLAQLERAQRAGIVEVDIHPCPMLVGQRKDGIELRRDLLVGEIIEVSQDDDGAELIGEVPEGVLEVGGEGFKDDALLGVLVELGLVAVKEVVLDGAQVIPAGWVRTSTRPLTRSPYSGLSYGYGWFLSRSGYALARGYGGQVIAFHSERDLAVAITSDPNRPARSEGYFGALMDLLDGPVLSL